MQPKFAGMNPYLENPELWSEVHFGLISVLARTLNAVITPKYRAAVEKRVYSDSLLVGIPDVSVFQRGAEVAQPQSPTATLRIVYKIKPNLFLEVSRRARHLQKKITG